MAQTFYAEPNSDLSSEFKYVISRYNENHTNLIPIANEKYHTLEDAEEAARKLNDDLDDM